jgi:hypothetical protein
MSSDYLLTMLAYLDPGAGSLLLQLLAGGLAGVAVMGRLYWRRVKRVLRLERHDDTSDEQLS